MTDPQTIEDLLRDEVTLMHVINVIETLRGELTDDPERWENASLDRYLEALQAWLSAFGDRLGDKPSWKLIAVMLEAATMYE